MAKIRPLGAVSDFVADGLLAEALESPAGLPARIEQLLSELEETCVLHALNSAGKSVARFDLYMIDAGLTHSGFPESETLNALRERFDTNDGYPCLRYEDVVLVNPADDMRMFTRGEIGETERRFYERHRLIEAELASMTAQMRAAIEEPDDERAATALTDAHNFASATMRYTGRLGGQSVDHFNNKISGFRRFLMTHPTRKFEGPSGEFSPGIPTIDLLLHGDQLGQTYLGYIDKRWKYYPSQTRESMQDARDWALSGKTLVNRWRGGQRQECLWQPIEAIGNFVNGFRKLHLRVVITQLIKPNGGGPVQGTGGSSDSQQHLEQRQVDAYFDAAKYRAM